MVMSSSPRPRSPSAPRPPGPSKFPLAPSSPSAHAHPLDATQGCPLVLPSSTCVTTETPRSNNSWRPHTVAVPPRALASAHRGSQILSHTRFSASTRRLRSSGRRRNELGRGRMSVTKVRTSRSRPFRPPFAQPPHPSRLPRLPLPDPARPPPLVHSARTTPRSGTIPP